ncbi:phage major capsid protein [Ottowia sp. VDI28]|uniref:phage major capsid protein n=1 Tax=Ottowia sp. VDI28 TaxID=3133968 RepID=UPI003C2F1721
MSITPQQAAQLQAEYKQVQQDLQKVGDDLKQYANETRAEIHELEQKLARPMGQGSSIGWSQDDELSPHALSGNGWKNSDGKPLMVLRSAKDIRSYYAARVRASTDAPAFALDDFVRGVAGMSTTPAVKAALSTGTDTAGGFALPSVVMPSILEALVPASSVLSAGAGIVPLDSGAKMFTTVAVDSIPTAAWRLESGDVAVSEPTFRAVQSIPKSLAFMFKISRELLADAPNLSQALTTAIAQAFAVELDRTALRGSGTNPEPLGILSTAGVASVTNGANGSALAGYANFFSAIQSILQSNAPQPTAAIMSPRSLVKLGGLVDSTGQPLRKPEMIEKLNMLSTTAIPNNLTVGTASDCSEIYVGDFSRVNFMMREQMSIQLAKELFAGTGEVGFICHVRADVAIGYPKALAVITGVKA